MEPDDECPLIELARGFAPTAPASDVRSDLKVFDDGRFTLDPRFIPDGVIPPDGHRIATDVLDELRQRVFADLDAWSIDTAGIERAIDEELAASSTGASGSLIVLGAETAADASITVIRLDDGTRRRELRFYNLAGAAARHPRIEPLQRLRAVEVHLLELAQRLGAR